MNMNNKSLIGAALILVTTGGASFNASATLASNAVLQFASGVPGCIGGYDTYPACTLGTTVTSGSYFAMDYNTDSGFSESERNSMTLLNGVYINMAQPASGSHSGSPDGTESASIDVPFSFFGNTGMHQTTSPVNILSDNGAGQVTLDFSGWSVIWDGISDIPLGGYTAMGETGIATLLCGTNCSLGDTFTLDYAAHIPPYQPSAFGNVYYGVHLEGIIGAVPVPAAVWLFGSGLIGLAGVARRRRSA